MTCWRCVFYGAAVLDVSKAMDLEKLKVLEAEIYQFLDQHEQVREQHDALLQRLEDREKQLAEVTGQLQRYQSERSEIRARLERILDRLEGLDLG